MRPFCLSLQRFVLVSLLSMNGCWAESIVRLWTRDTSFDNAANWNAARSPCDILAFPSRVSPVYVQTNTSLSEIILPNDGDIIFGSNTVLSFSGAMQNSNCSPKEVRFNVTTPADWFEPLNWCKVGDVDDVACPPIQAHRIDAEKVPCRDDIVTFPADKSFYVNLPPSLTLKKIAISGKTFRTTNELNAYLATEFGRKQFVQATPSTVVDIQPTSCDDVTGCLCGNNEGEAFRKICDFQRPRCVDLGSSCMGALTPKGHCCSLCGAILIIEYTTEYDDGIVRNNVHVITDHYTGVYSMVSKLSQNTTQIAFADDADGTAAVNCANDVRATLEGSKYSNVILRISFSASTSTSPKHDKLTGGGASNPSSIAGIVMAIIIAALLAGLAVYCFTDVGKCRRPRNLRLPKVHFSFKKFDNPADNTVGEGRLELAFAGTEQKVDLSKASTLKGFDNPMFGEPASPDITARYVAKDEESRIKFSGISSKKGEKEKGGQRTGFDNPMYEEGTPTIVSTTLQMNPVYSEDSIQEESI